MKDRIVIALIGIALTGGSFSSEIARAAVVEYTSASSFDAATTGETTYNFDGLAPVGYFSYYGTSITVGPATFVGNGEIFVIDASAGLGNYGVPYLSQQYGHPNTLTVSTSPTTAIAFDYGSYYNSGDALAITLSDGSIFDISLPSTQSTTKFVGFTSSNPISTVSFVDDSGASTQVLDITDFKFANVASGVPEPSTWAMMLLGFAGLGFACHNRAIQKRRARFSAAA